MKNQIYSGFFVSKEKRFDNFINPFLSLTEYFSQSPFVRYEIKLLLESLISLIKNHRI
jgi:hypothetical protein